ncbi:NADH-quinone oxidoreductase subunit NuoG [Candidatus Desulfobacillus denitrificans]
MPKGVMEFLLINHPLDCPICDQGGECQLQDLAVGYGQSAARYEEEKRVVVNKNLGPLIATDMTRCIHCTRCVRFTQEIAGLMELGQAFRGEHAEIMPFIEKTVDSELSGNVIDLCPVGALTSKPFRFAARTWELSRRKSVSPHDGLGANLIVQVKHDKVLRVLPLENEDVNECWLSDKDRFSYEALNSDARLTRPMLKQCGEWREVDWQTALEFIGTDLKRVVREHGAASVGALASPHATLEELHLLQKFVRGAGSENVDCRLRQTDFSLDGKSVTPWLGLPVAEIPALDRVLVVGSFLRKDHPLLAQRLRQAAKKSTRVSLLHVADDDQLIALQAKSIVAPSALAAELAGIVKAVGRSEGRRRSMRGWRACSLPLPQNRSPKASSRARRAPFSSATLPSSMPRRRRCMLWRSSWPRSPAHASGISARRPTRSGATSPTPCRARRVLMPRACWPSRASAYFVLHAEPELDCANPQQALAALKAADLVVALTPFKTRAVDYAHVILPIAPFTETSGTFINTEGRVQSFNAVVKPLGETRPAWKVLRVLGNLLGLPGFEQESSEAVRAEVLGGKPASVAERLNNQADGVALNLAAPAPALQRIADVPIHFADPLARRAPSLQKTRDAAPPAARMNAATLAKLGLAAGAQVKVSLGGTAILAVQLDAGVPDGCVRVAAGHELTSGLGPMQGELTVERA